MSGMRAAAAALDLDSQRQKWAGSAREEAAPEAEC